MASLAAIKKLFCNATTRYGTKLLLSRVIEHEAIQSRADAHCQKCLCGKPIALKQHKPS